MLPYKKYKLVYKKRTDESFERDYTVWKSVYVKTYLTTINR